MADGSKKWYVIRAISGKEKKVKEMIDLEMPAQRAWVHIAQVLIPMEKFYQIRDGKKVSKERNFFPGTCCWRPTSPARSPTPSRTCPT
jgi:transcriptional antiterminator NusG